MEQIQADNSLPLYIQLKDILTKKIKDGTLKNGERLPSERELCQTYDVSRITVRQALSDLENKGLISRAHGKGTFVTQSKLEQELYSITPFQNALLSKGLNPTTKYLDYKIISNTYKMSKILNLPIAEDLVELTLLGLGNDKPMAFYTSYFTCSLGLKMHELAVEYTQGNKSFTTIDLYNDLPDLQIGTVYQTFEASISDHFLSNVLEIKKGSPILIVESTVYSPLDEPLEYRIAVYRGDKYKFSVIRTINK